MGDYIRSSCVDSKIPFHLSFADTTESVGTVVVILKLVRLLDISFGYLILSVASPVRTMLLSSAERARRGYSKNRSEDASKLDNEDHLRLMLELLKKERLYAKFSKCECCLQEVHFLGHVVNHNGIHVDPSKIEAVKNWRCAYNAV
ncbi:hypothetical protein Tco_0624409 [Tanacetum coccineum]|uniref:C2H2-type domain-containing protein n=1 Tax=Tanacetum coccineum TaxID=301880 RepID=A0ABQ4WDT7_9ASTR